MPSTASELRLGTKHEHGNMHAAERVGEAYMQKEAMLYNYKWFDYRFMSPTDATDLFANIYREQYKLAWRRNEDIYEAPRKIGICIPAFDGEILTKKRHSNVERDYKFLWAARQRADAMGVRYDVFVGAGIEAHLRNEYSHLPRPNQLVTGDQAANNAKAIIDAWMHELEGSPDKAISKLPQYMNHAFCDLPAQVAHREWVLERLGVGRPFSVGLACYIAQVLPEAMALKAYGEERLKQARDEVAGEKPAAAVPVDAKALRPGCHEQPLVYRRDADPCRTCGFSAACATADVKARADFLGRLGCEDPQRAHRREVDRERQRRHRAEGKRKAGLARARAS